MPRRISLLQNTLPKEDITMGKTEYYRGIDSTLPSITIAPHEFRNIKTNSERRDLTLREMMEDSTATGLVLKANKPWRDAYSKLHYDFLNSIQTHILEVQIFEAIANFIHNCTDTLELMRG
jgi:nuclear pore complex protein Nup107